MPRGGNHRAPDATVLPPIDREKVRDISEKFYRIRHGPKVIAKMIEEDGGTSEKLRKRAASYDGMTVGYMQALDIPIPRVERAGLFDD